ncbi:Pyruvate kinase [bacterium HR40]|nr:Pyruvate kinase [bacterium HR40]
MTVRRSTKIVATLGPASASLERVEALARAGADVFRINASHGEEANWRTHVEQVRQVEEKLGRPIGILFDLQGPKIRLGDFEGFASLTLAPDDRLTLVLAASSADPTRLPLPHREVFTVLEPGRELLLDDGRIRLMVEQPADTEAVVRVVAGGTLLPRKGVNLPGVELPIPALTRKDTRDLAAALELGVDWIALSFVQRPQDVADARRLVSGRAAIMAKIEKPSAVERLERIVELADGIMVARGDLGVELPPEMVPGLQKRIVRRCRDAGKPVVVATQMLENMVHSPWPTRAEASDVATAVYDGADAVMLSAETAAGAYPVEAVDMMRRIIERVEADELYRSYLEAYTAEVEARAADAITLAAAQVAHTMKAAAIVTYTTSGATALRASRERPDRPILGLVTRVSTARKLTVAWGVHPVVSGDAENVDDMVEKARAAVRRAGLGAPGSAIVITAGMPFGTPGATNLLRLAWIT